MIIAFFVFNMYKSTTGYKLVGLNPYNFVRKESGRNATFLFLLDYNPARDNRGEN